jgi:hypothetical protein
MPERTRQFILIDQSIADTAGHYYEYAVHALRAAEQAGYEPVLATNRRFRAGDADSWKVVPVYHYGFWAALGELNEKKGRRGRAWARFKFRVRCGFRFSVWGMAWRLRDQFGDFLLGQPVDRAVLGPVARLAPLVMLLKLARFVGLLLLLPIVLAWALLWPLRKLASIKAVRQYSDAVLADVYGAVKFARYLMDHRKDARKWIIEFRCLRRFAADTADLLRRVPLGEGDIVFIPTLSNIELMGLSLYFDRARPPRSASWHLLFRRDIYRGRAGEYSGQEGGVDGLRQVFLRFGNKLAAQNVYFHTDTTELTAQYRKLGATEFSTLPIPHTHWPVETPAEGPLRVIYVGDARYEKGYQHIPAVIQSLWPDCVATGKAAFTLQSNYNVPNGEPEAVIARSQLESMPPRPVTLLKRALTSEEYQNLLLSGNINLLLYDRNNYYARSSGILVEALSAGMPPVVPAASWLSRQFMAETNRHLESWRERLPVARTYVARNMRWRAKDNAEGATTFAGEVTLGRAAVFSWIRVPSESTYALVSVRMGAGSLDDVQVTIEQLDGEQRLLGRAQERLLEAEHTTRQAMLLVHLKKQAESISLALASPFHRENVRVGDVRVDFFRCSEAERPPLGAVGAVYHEIAEVPEVLRDVIFNYAHYRETARAFAGPWREHHNAARLIAEIELAARRVRGGGRVEPGTAATSNVSGADTATEVPELAKRLG